MKRKPSLIFYVFVFTGIFIIISSGYMKSLSQADETKDLIQRGKKLIQEEKWEEAKVIFTKAVEINPKNADAHFGLAEIYRNLVLIKKKQGDFKNLTELSIKYNQEIEKTISLNPNHAPARFNRATSFLFSPPQYGGDIDKAVEDLEVLVSREPKNIDYLLYLGLAYKKKGKREDAKKAFIKILDLSPDHAQAKEELKLLKLQPFHIEKVNPMFDDFEDGDLFSNWQTKWMEMTDKYIGGSSTSKIQIMDEGAENSKKYLKITGKVTTQVAYGFAGIYIILDPDSFDPSTGNPVDITRFQGIKFWVKGSKNQYRINFITSSVNDYDYFMSVFSTSEDWKSIKVSFKELRQFGFGVPAKWTGKDVQGILVLTLTSPATGLDSFELDIDNICFY